MDVGIAVAWALLGVLVAELVEGLRLYARGDQGLPNRWPESRFRFRDYVTVSGIRLALGGVVAAALVGLDVLCDESLAFLAGLSTLKVVEVLFGYPGRPGVE